MFISNKVVFLELHKTGSSLLRKLFKSEGVLAGEIIGKNNQISNNLLTQDSIIVGSIRNPWDWYVSLWAYGCDEATTNLVAAKESFIVKHYNYTAPVKS
jgi:hypothetical protein